MSENNEPAPKKSKLDVDYWNERKDKILLKHGFPKHGLHMTRVIAVLEGDEDGLKESPPHLIYNDAGSLMGAEPFESKEEFNEACRKTVEYYEEVQNNRIKVLAQKIQEHTDNIINRKWTYQPQECEGTYTFEGKAYMTSGVREELEKDEVGFIVANMRKRIFEKKLETKNKIAEAAGIDYLQVFKSDDGKTVFLIDQLNHEMKKSGDFKPEYDYWTMMLSEEY